MSSDCNLLDFFKEGRVHKFEGKKTKKVLESTSGVNTCKGERGQRGGRRGQSGQIPNKLPEEDLEGALYF